jgi:hypothetical protein
MEKSVITQKLVLKTTQICVAATQKFSQKRKLLNKSAVKFGPSWNYCWTELKFMMVLTNYATWFWKDCRTQVYMWKRISEKEKTVSAWDWTGVISSGFFKSLTTRPSGLTGPCFTDRFYSNFNRIDHMLTMFLFSLQDPGSNFLQEFSA